MNYLVFRKSLRKILNKLRWPYRRLTWRYRMLPDFLIVGAMKSGTTTLYHHLAQHPALKPPYIKEIHFFDGGTRKNNWNNFAKGETWYQSHFPLKTNTDNHAFEATPGYILYPFIAKRVFDFNPKIKLIMLLRNPTERAISHYFHNERRGAIRKNLSMMDILQVDENRIIYQNQDDENLWIRHATYLERGLYAQQIERFLRYFPKQQILILSSDDFLSHPERIVKEVFEFVGVDAEFEVKNLSPRNVAKNKTAVDPEVRQYLNDYFLPHNKQLYKLLGKDFGW